MADKRMIAVFHYDNGRYGSEPYKYEEIKRGEWICHEGRWIDFWSGVFFQDYYPTKYECNQCHHYVDVGSDKNFCPNCGADMREREGE